MFCIFLFSNRIYSADNVKNMAKMSVAEQFEHLVAVISSSRFQNREGLGNEVPFFIYPFDPQQGADMDRRRENLIKRLDGKGVRILDVNLYDLSITLLEERGIRGRILEMETSTSKENLKELLQNVLDPETHLVPAIANRLARTEFDVLFLSGVGEVFPYIRSHNVLNNLQSTAKEKPTVMFFPGDYTHSPESGASLDLFGKLRDDKYYRAFNIFHYEA